MKIVILTLFPEMFTGFLNESIVKRAQEKGVVQIEIINIRDFADNQHKTVDDRPFGGGAGMVLMVEPIRKALEKARSGDNSGDDSAGDGEKIKTILTSARGVQYKQEIAQKYSKLDKLIIVAGHYEAIDERVTHFIDEEVSIGDFVLTGGELPAAVIADSIIRLLPGVLKKDDATELESFFEVDIEELTKAVGEDSVLVNLREKGIKEVQLLEYPHYTRPQMYMDESVPEVLLSGDPKKIRIWQLQEAFKKTKEVRPDLLAK
jgi:tRNA (guanine37-N1)-methyltransferase